MVDIFHSVPTFSAKDMQNVIGFTEEYVESYVFS